MCDIYGDLCIDFPICAMLSMVVVGIKQKLAEIWKRTLLFLHANIQEQQSINMQTNWHTPVPTRSVQYLLVENQQGHVLHTDFTYANNCKHTYANTHTMLHIYIHTKVNVSPKFLSVHKHTPSIVVTSWHFTSSH